MEAWWRLMFASLKTHKNLSNISFSRYYRSMSAHALERRSFIPRPQNEGAIQSLATFLQTTQAEQGSQTAYLVSPTGERQEVPTEIFNLLSYIVDALSEGKGVNVMPVNAKLTTQQAADHLGISRPTLVKLLEQGEIPFTKVGRHRRVTLEDLIEYERSANEVGRQRLRDLTQEASTDGTYFEHPDTSKTR